MIQDSVQFVIRKCDEVSVLELRCCNRSGAYKTVFFSMWPQLLIGVSVSWFRSDTVNAVVRIVRGLLVGGGCSRCYVVTCAIFRNFFLSCVSIVKK
jgi:hypothetical protein